MPKREEVYKLYKDFVELHNEQERKFKSFRADYSEEMDNVLKAFRGYDDTLQLALAKWFESTVKGFDNTYDKIKVEGDFSDGGCVLTATLDVDFDKEVRKGLGKLGKYMVGLFIDDEESFKQLVLFYTMKSKLDDVTEQEWSDLEQELKNALNFLDSDMNTLYDELVRAANYMLGRIHNEGLGICYYDLKHIIDPHYENAMSIYETLNEKQREIVKNSHVKGFDENHDEWVELLLYDYESLAEIYNLEKHVIELQEN